MIEMPGSLGYFFREPFKPRGLVAFAAPQKVGKSTWLRKVAYTGMLQRQKVGFVVLGDLSKEEVYRELALLNAKRPYKSTNQDGQFPCTVQIPTSLDPPQSDGSVPSQVGFAPKIFQSPLMGKVAWELMKETQEGEMGTLLSHLKLHVAAAASLSVAGLRSVLDSWIAGGFVPSVLILDYADNLAHTDQKLDYRHRVGEVWKGLSAIRQEYHLLLVTATQVKATAFHKGRNAARDRVLTREDVWRESAEILNHVTGIAGINQTAEEKSQGVCRLNWAILRGWQFDERKCIYCAGCLAVGDPCLISSF